MTGVYYTEEMAAPNRVAKGGPPTVWWRLDKGSWHRTGFRWTPDRRGSKNGAWTTGYIALGAFGPHQTRTLELSASFSAVNAHGQYTAILDLGNRPCGLGYTLGDATSGFGYHLFG